MSVRDERRRNRLLLGLSLAWETHQSDSPKAENPLKEIIIEIYISHNFLSLSVFWCQLIFVIFSLPLSKQTDLPKKQPS